MKKIKKKDICWFIEDEAIRDILCTIEQDYIERREYKIFEFKDKKYFLKSFRENGVFGFFRRLIYPRGKKEFIMGKALLSFSIHTPEPLGYGVSKKRSFIIQRYISGKSFLDLFYESEDKKDMLRQLAALLKSLNINKVKHNDLHLNNIIVNEEGMIYIVDLHKMEIKKHFTLLDEISNISHSLAMIYKELSDEEKDAFFSNYNENSIKKIVESALSNMWKRWIERKKKRAFKETSIVKRDKKIFYIKGTEWQKEDKFIETIKKDKKTEIHRFSDHIRKIYRDRRRLKKAWEAYVVLSYMSVKATPEIFFIKLPSITDSGFIAMEDLKGRGEELDRYLDRFYDHMDLRERAIIIERFSSFLKSLFQKYIFHKDFKACNVFVKINNEFLLLDMEDIVFKSVDEKDLIRMFIQLNTTIPKKVKNTDRLRFFLKTMETFEISKKDLAKKIIKASVDMDIVYEGIDGLKVGRFR